MKSIMVLFCFVLSASLSGVAQTTAGTTPSNWIQPALNLPPLPTNQDVKFMPAAPGNPSMPASYIPTGATVLAGTRTTYEIILSLSVLVFGLLILGGQLLMLLKLRQGWNVNSMRVAGLTLVITAGIFLITAGYSQEQIAPMVGLLGTIAGYLLGKGESKEKS